MLMGFYLLLRKSNLVPESDKGFTRVKNLARGNFYRFKNHYVVKIYWCKTIQFGNRTLDIPLLPNPDRRICPVFWLDTYFNLVPGNSTSPAFMYLGRFKLMSLTYAQLTMWLKYWVSCCGKDDTRFSMHALRRGGAQGGVHSGVHGVVHGVVSDHTF